ncbi:hypothetical protein LX69_01460 [Breznakibacter xylanolyticus]|uniref:Uncharacterized protein n=1 Tax=Breznakibacter xylanolyticus TaxID=990 RepID=A0A2W7NAT8_9BACT|nr:hypothetical protein [Breznakibacter xylanolyticus]PZX17411.1 hypothetical protein LX69_01460 [Breznakibacter xylanolyticus]
MTKKQLSLALAFILIPLFSPAQDSTKVSFDGGFDMVSRYIWRGLQFSDSPNLQPYATFSYGGLSLMGWASYATGKNYAEIDLYLSYSTKGLTLSINDYYNEDETNLSATNWTEWRKDYTGHLVEACLTYTTPSDKHPITITASTFIFGYDRDDEGQQLYSTYFEAAYPFIINDYNLSAFAGATLTDNGFYASNTGFVNVGIQAEKDIRITEQFSVPLNLSIVHNPQNDDSFFVVKLSF